jgi:hypothetical protein
MDSDFLPRTLWRHQSDEIVEFEHSELDSLFRKDHRPLIILGEAGMGKTALLKWLADTHGYRFVTTRHLSLPLAPIHPLDTTQVLVIDALDELAASSSTDALLKTLVSLANLGYPRFILSCRASDWRDAESAELFESLGLYDKPHLELHLKALTDEQVQQILRKRLGETGACNLIAYLRARRLDDWLGNPHTLGLIMGAAASGSPLPEGRAGLFELAISQSLSEHKPSKSAVAPTERDALDAAGAACTALILGDFDSISRTSGRRHALPLKEASELPGGGCLSQVLGTRLFDSVGVDSFNYTHRSLGEYYHGTDGHTIKLDVSLVEWTISNFRSSWPHSETPIGEIVEPAWFGSNEGGLAQLIHTLGSLTTPEAIDALTRLSDAPRDTYTTLLLDAKSRQQRLCHESTFTPPTLGDLIAITRDEPPRSSVDLQAWVIEELRAIQAMIKSDDIDSWRGFYLDDQINHQKEDRCRDYLLALLRQGSAGVVYDPEKHIAADKEVDIMCSTQSPSASLPIEIKGQWHPAVWDAADRQLDRLYTTDHKAGGLGIYLVLWFGKHARLQGPGRGVAAPSSPEEMAQMLQARCQAVAQGRVKIVVLDLARNTVDA